MHAKQLIPFVPPGVSRAYCSRLRGAEGGPGPEYQVDAYARSAGEAIGAA